MDIYEVTVTLLGSLEDVIEMSQEQQVPCIGSCFEGENLLFTKYIYCRFNKKLLMNDIKYFKQSLLKLLNLMSI